MDDVGRDHGLMLHAAAPAEDGFVIVNLWPSRAGSEAAARDERRLSVIDRHGLDPSRFDRHHYDVAKYLLLGAA